MLVKMLSRISRYWGRKQLSVTPFIDVSDRIIVDPFGGSGVFTLEALGLGRKAVYSDVNPYAWLVAHVSIAGCDVGEFNVKSRAVLSSAHELEGRVSVSRFRGDRLWYPWGRPFLKRRNYDRVSDFFGRGAFRRLWALKEAVDSVDASFDTRLALYLAFSNTLYPSSLMKRCGAGSWGVPSYWAPPRSCPEDPYMVFERAVARMARVLLRMPRYKVGYRLEDLGRVDAVLLLNNALTLRYESEWTIVTDPPHTDEVQYMELSYFHWAWLKSSKLPEVMKELLDKKPRMRFSAELVVNLNKGLTLEGYLERLRQFARRVKSTRRRVIVLHEEDLAVMKTIIDILRREWREIKEEKVEVQGHRSIGPRGGRVYTIVTSPQ